MSRKASTSRAKLLASLGQQVFKGNQENENKDNEKGIPAESPCPPCLDVEEEDSFFDAFSSRLDDYQMSTPRTALQDLTSASNNKGLLKDSPPKKIPKCSHALSMLLAYASDDSQSSMGACSEYGSPMKAASPRGKNSSTRVNLLSRFSGLPPGRTSFIESGDGTPSAHSDQASNIGVVASTNATIISDELCSSPTSNCVAPRTRSKGPFMIMSATEEPSSQLCSDCVVNVVPVTPSAHSDQASSISVVAPTNTTIISDEQCSSPTSNCVTPSTRSDCSLMLMSASEEPSSPLVSSFVVNEVPVTPSAHSGQASSISVVTSTNTTIISKEQFSSPTSNCVTPSTRSEGSLIMTATDSSRLVSDCVVKEVLDSVSTITFANGISSSEMLNDVLSSVDLSKGDAFVLPLEPDELLPGFFELAEEGENLLTGEATIERPTDGNEGETETENQEKIIPKPRCRNTDKWKRNVVRGLKNSGEAHVSLRGKVREAKTMGEGCNAKCKRNCHHIFSEDARSKIFHSFWALKDHTAQWCYIASHVRSENVKRRTVAVLHGTQPHRNFTYIYQLPLDGCEKQVCQKFFLDTLSITRKWVRTAMKKKINHHGAVPRDGRGKNKKKTVVKSFLRNDVMNHIKKFPTIEGHYTRKNSKSLYLPEHLNQRMMHSMYVIEKEAAGQNKIATLRQHRDVFRKEFNLKFYRPKKDQCGRCLSWKNRTPQERTAEAKAKYDKHLDNKRVSNQLKSEDIDKIKEDEELQKTVCVASFDLEKVLLCQTGNNGEFYYKSRLNVHNFTIFVSGHQEAFCYGWDQTVAGKGSPEITSCVWSFIQMMVEKGCKEFHFYSDNCTPQNKNQFLFSMYVMASIRYSIKIQHRYLEVGHTHVEVDSVHATIEKSVKNKDIFVPSQWYMAFRSAKKNRPYYQVKELSQEDIFDFRPVAEKQTWSKLKTSQFKEIVINGEEPGVVKFKTEYANDSSIATVIKKDPGRPVNWKTLKLQKRYTSRIPLKPHELADLQSLCRSGAIPSVYASYYMVTLPSLTAAAVEPPPPPELSDVESDEESDPDGDLAQSGTEENNDSSDEESENVSDDEDDDDFLP